MQPESRVYISQRLKMHYVVWGDEANPPLLLVHGTRDHARSWDRTAMALVDRYCVYAPDLRGHGDSDWANGGTYSIIDYALDMHALAEAIGRGPYTVVGHSLGGVVSLQYAGSFPEKVSRLITIEGLGRGDGRRDSPRERHRTAHERMSAWIRSMHELEQRKPHVYASLDEATERMLEANKHLTPELARHLTVHGARAVEGGYVWKFDNFTRAGSPYEFNVADATDLWAQVTCPHLVIVGQESWMARREREIDLSPYQSWRMEVVQDAGHWVHHDQFELFMGLVNGFLDD